MIRGGKKMNTRPTTTYLNCLSISPCHDNYKYAIANRYVMLYYFAQ